MENNLKRLTILQRWLHIVDLQLKIATKEGKQLYMAVYEKMDHVKQAHKDYVKRNSRYRRAYHRMYNRMFSERISQQNKEYYKAKRKLKETK